MSTSVASAAAVGPPPGMKVRLSSNESPFGPAPGALAAMRDTAAAAHLYPDDQSRELRAAIARRHGVDVEHVSVGNGSAGLLMDVIAHAARRADSAAPEVLTYERAFIVYRLGAQVVGAELVAAPVGAAYERDPDALLERVTPDTCIVCIDNPSNPSGRHLSGDALTHVVEHLPDDVIVVVDEAYHHFAEGRDGYVTVEELGLEHPNLLVLRTFSKAHALAGLRVGYQVGPPDLVAVLDRDRVRFNVNAMAQAAALAALDDDGHLQKTIEGTVAGRRRMAAGLEDLGVPIVAGLGNFVLIELGEPAPPIVEAYGGHGVGVRPLAPYGMHDQIRVTVGTPDEVEAFLDASADVLAGVASRR